jgi:hypothetical protein
LLVHSKSYRSNHQNGVGSLFHFVSFNIRYSLIKFLSYSFIFFEREVDFDAEPALGIAAKSPQRSEDLKRKARPKATP